MRPRRLGNRRENADREYRVTGPQPPKIHHHAPGEGRTATEHADPGERHTSHDQERDRLYQPPSKRVRTSGALSKLGY